MKRQDMRVIVASEHPRVQYILRQLVEDKGRAMIVGQAQDAGTTLTLVRNLRPDIVVIDCYLPHVTGLDTQALSRMGGLDIAQAISEELPNARVILLNNLDSVALTDRSPTAAIDVVYSIKNKDADVTFGPEAITRAEPKHLLFASIEAQPAEAVKQKTTSLSDKVIFFGGLGIGIGWLLTITMILAPVGFPLAIAGGITLFLGLAAKLSTSLWHNILNKMKGVK